MSGLIVQAVYAVDDGASATTIAATLNGVVAGNHIVAHVGWDDATGSITATVSDGTSYTSGAAKVRHSSNLQAGQVFYLENVGSGSHTVTATFSTSTDGRRIRISEVSGLQTSSSLDKATGQEQTTPGTGANNVSSGASAATTNAHDFVMGFSQDTSQVDPGTGTLTAGTGYTITGTNVILGLESKSVTVTGAQTATFTQSVNNNRVTHVIAFKETTSTVTGNPIFNLQNPGLGPRPAEHWTLYRSAVNADPPPPDPAGRVFKFINPGKRPGPIAFPQFRQGVPAPTPPPDPATWMPKFIGPGRGPGRRQFPEFVQGIFAVVTIDGSLATSNANDTLVAVGTITVPGTLASSNNNDTLAATGTTTVTGTLASSNNNDTLAASGSVGNSVSGTLASSNNDDTLVATGSPIVPGTLASSNANDTLVATGTTTVTGTLASSNNNDTLSASGTAGGGGGGTTTTRLPLTGAGT